ncbi:MAG: hypothetical protein LBT89_11250, partial [Planctomycetaceae bacterium]|nr:hypothetical protein [Planctomycetaceae bacterium]
MRLTAFEEYMLLDSHPAYPMSCFIELILKGDFDSAAFTEAADAAVRLHPLLSCSAEQTADGYHRWVPHEPAVCVIVSENTGTSSLPVSGGIDLFREVPLKITVCRLDAAVTQITMEVHHTACDAAGAFRFAEDVLYGYACRKGAADVSVQREAVKPELLPQRGKYGLTPSVWLRILPKQLWGLTRAWMFLFRRIRPLVPVQP